MKTNQRVRDIIVKWYKALPFDSRYDEEFYRALDEVYISPDLCVESYPLEEEDGRKNLLSFLYFSDALCSKYSSLGIDRDIFIDTLEDLVRWTDIWSEIKGELYLGELEWLWHIFTLRIVKLGRLQFCTKVLIEDIESFGLKKGDPVLDVHIPAAGPLDTEECIKSFRLAESFYPRFFPDFKFKCFTCHSWLLDRSIEDLLPTDSNIIRFGRLFEIVKNSPSRAILSYVLRWKITDEQLSNVLTKSSFAERVKQQALAGRTFFAPFGIRGIGI